MKTVSSTCSLFLARTLFLVLLIPSAKPDPDPLQDYCVADTSSGPPPFFVNGYPCIDPKLAISAHFVTSALSKPGNTAANPFGFSVTLTSIRNMPGVNTQGLAMARVDIAPLGLVPLHWHPRASEIAIVIQGNVLVGFVDTSNRLFIQQLRTGDSFVFPKATMHFLYNLDSLKVALVISGLNSQNPGAELVALASFVSNPVLPAEVLQKSFRINEQDVLRIRRNLGG
ncbi:hypothetical protein Scep_021590 [Stephania cephalantha]|uniref:Germin-like protein n=1 Tax=Stephania cephalantha TaxID=152367 RepID=A0AAP0I1I8_9MAGN